MFFRTRYSKPGWRIFAEDPPVGPATSGFATPARRGLEVGGEVKWVASEEGYQPMPSESTPRMLYRSDKQANESLAIEGRMVGGLALGRLVPCFNTFRKANWNRSK
jgi:hypothetical protein